MDDRHLRLSSACVCALSVQVEWSHQIIEREEKIYMVVAAVAGAITAFCLLVWVGPPALAFNLSAASEELTSRVAVVVRARFKNVPDTELQPVTEPGPMGTVLALVGGLLGKLTQPEVLPGGLCQQLEEVAAGVK